MTANMSEAFELPLHMAIARAADEHDADKATIAALVAALHEVVEQHGKRFGAFDELCDSSVQPPDIQRAMAALALAEGRP